MVYTNPTPGRRKVETPKGAAIFMVMAVVLLWVLEAIDTVLLGALDKLGIHAQEPMGGSASCSPPSSMRASVTSSQTRCRCLFWAS